MRRAQRHSNELIESGGSDVVSQIEASERRQVADARLLREMHDFFEGATRTAAGILQQVSHEAEHETAARLRGEMQDFLSDVLRRADSFMHAAGLPSECGPNGEAVSDVAAKMQNLVGPMLDEFRHESNVGADKHIGVDPFRADPGVFADAINRETASTTDDAPPIDDSPLDPSQSAVPLLAGGAADAPLRASLNTGTPFDHTLSDETVDADALNLAESDDVLDDEDLEAGLELVDSLGGFEERELEQERGGQDSNAAEPSGGASIRATEAAAEPVVDDHDEIEEHLVADLDLGTRPTPLLEEPTRDLGAVEAPAAASAAGSDPLLAAALECPERARIVLKAMVQAGVLTKEQARDLYRQSCAATSSS